MENLHLIYQSQNEKLQQQRLKNVHLLQFLVAS